MKLRVLDLCAGTFGFSRGFIERGDIVLGIDTDARLAAPDGAELLRADVTRRGP